MRKKIVLVVIAVLIISLGVLCIWQKNNIIASLNYTKYNEIQIVDKISESKKNVEEELGKYMEVPIRDFTPEEELALMKGKLTPKEAVDELVKERDDAMGKSNTSTQKPEGDNNQQVATSNNDASYKNSELVGDFIAQLYGLKASYLSSVGSFAKEALAEYDRIKRETGKVDFALISTKYITRVAKLEDECDKKVNDLLKSLSSELSTQGESQKIITIIRDAYEKEKALKKAYYLKLISDRKL